MGGWERLQPVLVDNECLPANWDLIRDPETGYYAVVGGTDAASVDIVVRIDYAVTGDGEDIRKMVASAVLQGLEGIRLR